MREQLFLFEEATISSIAILEAKKKRFFDTLDSLTILSAYQEQ
jgi:hypothetical protein